MGILITIYIISVILLYIGAREATKQDTEWGVYDGNEFGFYIFVSIIPFINTLIAILVLLNTFLDKDNVKLNIRKFFLLRDEDSNDP